MTAKFMRSIVGAVFLVVAPAGSFAQDNCPSRAIKMIVPIPPGAAADSLPRIIADSLAACSYRPLQLAAAAID